MITFKMASEREYWQRRELEAWCTFSEKCRTDSLGASFGALRAFQEGRLAPRAGIRVPRRDAEVITYVRDGTMIYEDSIGHSGLLGAGEFQRMTVGRGVRYSEANASPTEWAQVFQIWLHPSEAVIEPGHEQRRFSAAQRRGVLCPVASPDARNGSLQIHQDAVLYSSIVGRGQHIIHEIGAGRGVWLHVVRGTATVGAVRISTGDGVGISDERAASMTATAETEILLLDLGSFAGMVVPGVHSM